MSPATFFFVGMFFIWAVLSGKALAIWNAVIGSAANSSSNTNQPANNAGAPIQSVNPETMPS